MTLELVEVEKLEGHTDRVWNVAWNPATAGILASCSADKTVRIWEQSSSLSRSWTCKSLSSSIEGGTKWLVNKLKGKMQKPLPELLKEFGLPVGIFPQDATNYEFNEETGKLTVFIPETCEVGYRDSSVLRFSTTVTGYLEKGKLAEVDGLKTKVMIWVKVSCISADTSKVYFTAGMKKSRSRDAYEVIRPGVGVDKF